jgi:hypothetical protein
MDMEDLSTVMNDLDRPYHLLLQVAKSVAKIQPDHELALFVEQAETAFMDRMRSRLP